LLLKVVERYRHSRGAPPAGPEAHRSGRHHIRDGCATYDLIIAGYRLAAGRERKQLLIDPDEAPSLAILRPRRRHLAAAPLRRYGMSKTALHAGTLQRPTRLPRRARAGFRAGALALPDPERTAWRWLWLWHGFCFSPSPTAPKKWAGAKPLSSGRRRPA